jgi:hypothetical protein
LNISAGKKFRPAGFDEVDVKGCSQNLLPNDLVLDVNGYIQKLFTVLNVGRNTL